MDGALKKGVWGKRLIAVPSITLIAVASLLLLPLTLTAALLVDAFRKRPLPTTGRVVLVTTASFWVEFTGVLMSVGAWLMSGAVFGRGRERLLSWDYRLQHWWGRSLFGIGRAVFGMRVTVEGAETIRSGPAIIFIRHASAADAILPAAFVSQLRLRYVLKDGLLWTPCMNIVGNRTPNYFVRRGAGGESQPIGELARNMGQRDAVLIYPEGMVLTPEKAKEMDVQALRASPEGSEEGYQRVLRPRLGGPLAILEKAAGVDVIFCGHVGFEVAPGFRDLARGGLIHATILIRFWRVPGSEVPTGSSDRRKWLQDRWHEMDSWVGEKQMEMGVTSRIA